MLAPSQLAAIQHVELFASKRMSDANASIDTALAAVSVDRALFEKVAALAKTSATVELNFHPDRRTAAGKTVAEELLSDGIYRSQFETQLSNGSRTACPGGIRFEWEHRRFGGAYDDRPAVERPKYGALNLLAFADGSAPRFGSCYICLRPSVSLRTTFSYGDSVSNPRDIGTMKNLQSIWSAMLHDILRNGHALGVSQLTIPTLLNRVRETLQLPLKARLQRQPGRALDDYVEAQIHGEIRFDRDVESVVADPSLGNTRTGQVLRALSRKFAFPLHFHRGFVVAIDGIPDDFRGPAIPRLARRISPDGTITAKDLGDASIALHDSPSEWIDWGTVDETMQNIKQLWHALVQFGEPPESDSSDDNPASFGAPSFRD